MDLHFNKYKVNKNTILLYIAKHFADLLVIYFKKHSRTQVQKQVGAFQRPTHLQGSC